MPNTGQCFGSNCSKRKLLFMTRVLLKLLLATGVLLLMTVGCGAIVTSVVNYRFPKDESYKCLKSGKYSLHLKEGGYWVCLFPRWTPLGLVKTRLPTNVTVVIRDKDGIEVEQSHEHLLSSGTYTHPGSGSDSGQSRYYGYDFSSFVIEQKGVYVLEYRSSQACLLVLVPSSSVGRNLGSRTELFGVFNDDLESANYRHPDLAKED